MYFAVQNVVLHKNKIYDNEKLKGTDARNLLRGNGQGRFRRTRNVS